jgi:hypothetical protein
MKTQTSRTVRLRIATCVGLFVFAAGACPSTASGAGREAKSFISILQAKARALNAVQQATVATATPENAAYQFVTIDIPGTTYTQAYGVNDVGLVSGFYLDANGSFNGFLWRDGKMTTHDYPQALETILGDASNAGIVIGNYGAAALHAVLFDVHESSWHPLPDIEGQPVNFGNGINNRGVGTGEACRGNYLTGPTPNCIAWTWNGKQYSFFLAPGSNGPLGGTNANGINDMDKVAGYFTDSGNVNHGFIKDGDDFSMVDVPGATNTYVFDINDRSETVGYYADANGVIHGFVERHGQFTTVDVPDSLLTLIYGNDARGDIAGAWLDSSLVFHGFIGLKRE